MTELTNAPQQYDREATLSDLLGRVDQVREVLLDCADDAERDGFYPERGWQAMHDAGLFRSRAPLELGGFQADPCTHIKVLSEVARIDTSAGWTMMVGAGVLGLVSAWLPDEGLDAFMVDGRLPRAAGAAAPSGKATRVDGGYQVTGRWAFGSGSAHAERLTGGAFIEGEKAPPLGFVFNAEDVTLHDNWDVHALRGTGSQDFSVEGVFVPEELTFSMFTPAKRGGPGARIGGLGFVAHEHAAFALGVGRRAIDEMTELAKTKTRGHVKTQGVAARGKFQFDLGHADTALDSARDHLLAVYGEAWEIAQDGQADDPQLQARLRAGAAYATDIAVDVSRSMFSFAGGKSLYRGNIIERCLRDVQAGAQHIMVSNDAYDVLGRELMGLEDAGK